MSAQITVLNNTGVKIQVYFTKNGFFQEDRWCGVDNNSHDWWRRKTGNQVDLIIGFVRIFGHQVPGDQIFEANIDGPRKLRVTRNNGVFVVN
jgi:hypothetical protein